MIQKEMVSKQKLLDELNDMAHDAHIHWMRTLKNRDWYIGYCEALETLEKKIRNGELDT